MIVLSFKNVIDKMIVKRNELDGSIYVILEKTQPKLLSNLDFWNLGSGLFGGLFNSFSNNMISLSNYFETLAISYMVLDKEITLSDSYEDLKGPIDELKERKKLKHEESFEENIDEEKYEKIEIKS